MPLIVIVLVTPVTSKKAGRTSDVVTVGPVVASWSAVALCVWGNLCACGFESSLFIDEFEQRQVL